MRSGDVTSIVAEGENLLIATNQNTTTDRGITFTPQSNGSYKGNGTATGRIQYLVKTLNLQPGTYTLCENCKALAKEMLGI